MFSLFIEGEMASGRVFIVFMQIHGSDPSRRLIITQILNNHKYICSFINCFAVLDIREVPYALSIVREIRSNFNYQYKGTYSYSGRAHSFSK